MRVIADLHIHSRYSRATSPQMGVETLSSHAKTKGVNLLGTGDFTHPKYFSELKRHLKPYRDDEGTGLYECGGMAFMLTSEVSCIWPKNGVKRAHLCLCAPSLEIAEQVNEGLGKIGNLSADGRPVFGAGLPQVTELVMGVSRDCFVYPAHAWTPWFSVFGSESGFDSMEEAFEDQVKHVHALETGLSSDPPMNWRLSALDKYALLSNSDAHSPEKIGREANVFELPENGVSYKAVLGAVEKKDLSRFKMTVEFFPEEGKYHWDGHRAHEVSMAPKDAIAGGNLCPVCGKPLTIGVLHRVEELADRPEGFAPKGAVPFVHLVPLKEVIGDALESGAATKSVQQEYDRLVSGFGTELDVLLCAKPSELRAAAPERVAEAVLRAREGNVLLKPGYDGVYGKVSLFAKGGKPEEKRGDAARASGQKGLTEFC
ncbi:MAG: endonuclease Q family protein [Candidatus ainarchaeum sp.]|nr:endonuclease Q family protein [Candidatus ainarchaeum sp.]